MDHQIGSVILNNQRSAEKTTEDSNTKYPKISPNDNEIMDLNSDHQENKYIGTNEIIH